MIRPDRLGHLVIKVRDLKRSLPFYRDLLGLDVMREAPEIKAVFLASRRRDHHELGLLEVGPDATEPEFNQIGLAHFAIRLNSHQELEQAYRRLKEADVRLHFTVNHGVNSSVYFFDPDGIELEIYADNSPEMVASMPDAYLGTDKLSFAAGDPGVLDVAIDVAKKLKGNASPAGRN